MIPQALPTRYLLNRHADRSKPYGPEERSMLDPRMNQEAFREISSWMGYESTPLIDLSGLARRLGIGSLWYKDEGSRFGLGSFKALGGAYGVLQVLKEEIRRADLGVPSSSELLAGRYQELVRHVTVTCASLGNHGRSVARGAAMFGCRAVVFLPKGTAAERVDAIQRLGTEVETVDGSYDDALAEAARRAEDEGWLIVSDAAYPGYEEIPRRIMHGYTVMAREAMGQLPEGNRPSHLFLQGGVGGLAAAMTGYFWEAMGPDRPVVVVVEPAAADCLMESALVGQLSPSKGNLQTALSCLACRDPSPVAWQILRTGADAFLTVADHSAQETVEMLKRGVDGDRTIRSQPSGVAGLTGLISAVFEPTLAGPLGLGEESVVMVVGSEGPPGTSGDRGAPDEMRDPSE
jgi:diaminopropionate ammonia-lyase